MEVKTAQELLIERLGEEYFKDMPKDVKEKMLRMIVFMMLM